MEAKSLGEKIFGDDKSISEEERTATAKKVFDAAMTGFPVLKQAIAGCKMNTKRCGYTETILGRRRHLPNIQLPQYEFKPEKGYINPDIDPLNPATFQGNDGIPQRIQDALLKELKSYKYKGQVYRRIRELSDVHHIKVVDNSKKIAEAERESWNCVDFDTEILTCNGWKRYDEISVGDTILSYSMTTNKIERDEVTAVHVYNEPTDVVRFKSTTFDFVSTSNHRWVVGAYDQPTQIKTTDTIQAHKNADYPIYRIADNSLADNPDYTDDMLRLVGWYVTDGSRNKKHYGIVLYQSVRKAKNKAVFDEMQATVTRMGVCGAIHSYRKYERSIYVKQNTFTQWMYTTMPDRVLDWGFLSSLSQRQAGIVLSAMLQGDGWGVNGSGQFIPNRSVCITARSKNAADAIQYLCTIAGYATNCREVSLDAQLKWADSRDDRQYDSMHNNPHPTKEYYVVSVLKVRRAHICKNHCHQERCDGVWCVSTHNGTWIARRYGMVTITGNSVVQGSAAELTKMAMLRLENDPEWIEIGGRLILPVHDELIVEVPFEHRAKGAEILKRSMEEAGSFLPFAISCDIEMTFRWYGLAVDDILSFEVPIEINFDTMSESNIKWLQSCLFEQGYVMPVYKNEDGSKPIGNAAKGINGKVSDELKEAYSDYMAKYGLTTDAQFIKHIDTLVKTGEMLSIDML